MTTSIDAKIRERVQFIETMPAIPAVFLPLLKLLNSPDGKLHEGTPFSWDTFGLHFESRVHEFVPNSRIGWFGNSPTTNGYHTYLLSKTNEGCHVVTESCERTRCGGITQEQTAGYARGT